MMKRAADRFLLLCSVNVTDWPGHVNIDIYILSDENWKEAVCSRHLIRRKLIYRQGFLKEIKAKACLT